MIPLHLPANLARQIEAEGVRAYPNECCGIMFGHQRETQTRRERRVLRLQPVPNVFDEAERFHRFSIDPLLLMRAERAAAATGEVVLGFYHSHPDQPARPSAFDREHAWPFYSYVIVSICGQQPIDMTSWVLDDGTTTFQRQDLVEND